MISMFDLKSGLDDRGITYFSSDDDQQLTFEITGRSNNRTIVAILLNDKSNAVDVYFELRVKFFVYNFEIAKTINRYNCEYKWFQFFVTKENEFRMKMNLDCKFTDNEEYVLAHIVRGLMIIDEIYPETQRLLWAE